MKKKIAIIVCVILVLVLLIPIPLHLKDGGTVEYHALLYSVSNVHRIAPDAEDDDFEEGTIIKILGIEIYNNVE